jgi:NADH-quinone oxidoreductase subunit M
MATGIAALAVPGSAMFASEFLVLLGAFRRAPAVGAIAAATIVLAAMYMLRWISAILHDAPDVSAPELDRFASGVGWGWLYLLPLTLAVLVLSAYPYGVTHRVETSAHTLTAPAAREAAR